jgi:hypothetical protein
MISVLLLSWLLPREWLPPDVWLMLVGSSIFNPTVQQLSAVSGMPPMLKMCLTS